MDMHSALQKLDKAVKRLEGSAVSLERRLSGAQPDMFAPPLAALAKRKKGGKKQEAQPAAGIEAAIIAERLDTAIAQVQMLLEERS